MDNSYFYKIIGFLSDHFDLLIAVNGAILFSFVAVLILVRLRDIDFRRILYQTFKGLLFFTIVCGQIILVFMYVYLYWKNYQKPAPVLNLDQHVLATTQWVNDNQRIYFIDGHTLRSIKINDRDAETVFSGDHPVKEYHFSPDGKYVAVLTNNDLFLVERETKQSRHIDGLMSPGDGEKQDKKKKEIRGSIGGVQWAPDSQKFVYEVARWSEFSTQDYVYIYDLKNGQKRMVKSPTRRISSLYWDKQSKNLYYLYHESRSPSHPVSEYEVTVFRIPFETLVPELILRIPVETASVPIENLHLRDIELYLEGDQFSFGIPGNENDWVSEKGSKLGIDDDDCLYFVNSKWFRKRLYKIPREPRATEIPRYQYKGGDLVIGHIRWVPGGRYVIMEHRYWGVLILEPRTGKIGLLLRANGHAFGWYPGDA